MARKAAYVGGAWQVGGVRASRPAAEPAERRRQLRHYIAHARRRATEGHVMYRRMIEHYQAELAALAVPEPAGGRAIA